ncbi:hypothetical protein HMF8227_01891 [Saliniradius amylolyticus]|uniref:DUF4177 domain-containing protein n=1 Tax=Saliniradius amylolyticus TaxID=2183582 RepID=A0A2S2E3Y2_9ALTE|nr:DUF4177 domain-containing protein [Saliniradius amylolyticus]AWL12361.1 hypothetical protein HMF8227_01891 [Saliniradius amylolyticus]
MNWEYKTAEIKVKIKGFITTYCDSENLQNYLSDMGRQGWELVTCQFPARPTSAHYVQVVLKRPKS